MPPVKLPTTKSPWQQHAERWRNGCGNTICTTAMNVCLGRGVVPADIVFVGEGPGQSENALGEPFIGPAGRLLDTIIANAGLGEFRLAFTNLVGCMPSDSDTGEKATEPDIGEIKQCSRRLREFFLVAKPRAVVCVGATSERYCPRQPELSQPDYKVAKKGSAHFFDTEYKLPWMPAGAELIYVSIVHPAFILRSKIVRQGYMVQEATVKLAALGDKL